MSGDLEVETATLIGLYLLIININVPINTVFPVFPILFANTFTKHPSPPPKIVPIPRSNPLLNVAPVMCINYQLKS